ncbi:hypothetical protein [Amycolatopsis suaedae]|uniref:Cysteine dioxygenase n=1 Tax=Amycolatopsis suaedae TaxID=2510978 RepID=A0A4Q7J0U0_9PSEU|nr:hypothetical protein [Amycolatopsis suaedae]RZQ59554.1 hypothetical protein EWH70_33760 [Amycolatopsis suaedae]
MPTRPSALAELADAITATGAPLPDHWRTVAEPFTRWVRRPGLREQLRTHLCDLPAAEAEALVARSRETTTHFAWCLRDEPAEPFSFWLHEYKRQQDWRPGYADSVHNHRYHFCTTILRGSYLHERYDTTLDEDSGLVTSAVLSTGDVYPAGTCGTLLAHEFHRIPKASDRTMTFLVKSRPVNKWSLSYDPVTRTGQKHVPVETRLGELLATL